MTPELTWESVEATGPIPGKPDTVDSPKGSISPSGGAGKLDMRDHLDLKSTQVNARWTDWSREGEMTFWMKNEVSVKHRSRAVGIGHSAPSSSGQS